MRVLVVGGAGFVGSHLVDRLLAEGHLVDVVDDLSSGSLGNLAAARAGHVGSLKFHNLDVAVPELSALLARVRPDVAVHLALPAGRSGSAGLARALAGTTSLLEAATDAGTAKVVVGLDGVVHYGQVTMRDLPVKEGATAPPSSAATIASRAVADLLAFYHDQRSLEYTALALGTVYGPRQRPDGGVVAAFLAARRSGRPTVVHGNGRQTRDLVAVDDTVDAVVRATTRGTGLLVNVGTGTQTSVADIYERVIGRPPTTEDRAPGRPDEVGRFALSPVRARIRLAWAPWTEVAGGLAALVADADAAEAATSPDPGHRDAPAPERVSGTDPPADPG